MITASANDIKRAEKLVNSDLSSQYKTLSRFTKPESMVKLAMGVLSLSNRDIYFNDYIIRDILKKAAESGLDVTEEVAFMKNRVAQAETEREIERKEAIEQAWKEENLEAENLYSGFLGDDGAGTYRVKIRGRYQIGHLYKTRGRLEFRYTVNGKNKVTILSNTLYGIKPKSIVSSTANVIREYRITKVA